MQVLERIPEDEVVEANLDTVEQHPHARFCTTLGDGDNRYHWKLLETTAFVVAKEMCLPRAWSCAVSAHTVTLLACGGGSKH